MVGMMMEYLILKGCYAKTVNLDPKKEPDIFKAIKKDALLENVIVDDNGK